MSKILAGMFLSLGSMAQNCETIYIHPADQAIVDDAFLRFFGRVIDEPRAYFAIVLRIGEHRCVHLRPRPRTLGPYPTYCYDENEALVAVHGLQQ